MIEQNKTRKIFILEKLEKMINDFKWRTLAKDEKENPATLRRETAVINMDKEASVFKQIIKSDAGIKKEFLKTKKACRVTFRLPRSAAPDAKSVCIVGDFNKWDIHANPMEKQENGDYIAVFGLESGREYQFRYLIDESRWENDWNADKYVSSPYGDSENSVIIALNEGEI